MKKYSIIIPHYNNPRGLQRLLASIPDNDFIEIFIIDDNSTSGKEFCLSLQERAKVIFLDKNVGAGACRNIGLNYVSSKWILFADSDDYFTSDAFSYLDEFYSSNADIIFFSVDSFIEGTDIQSDRHILVNKLVYDLIKKNDQAIRYCSAVPWGKMINAKLVREKLIKFDEVICSNDVIFSLKVGHAAKNIKGSKKKVYVVTRNNCSLTSNKDKKSLLTRLSVTLRANSFLYNVGKRKYQISLIKILVCYKFYIPLNVIKDLLFNVITFRQKLFPKDSFSIILSGDFLKKLFRSFKNIN